MVRVLEARTLRCYVDAPRATCCAAGLGGGLEGRSGRSRLDRMCERAVEGGQKAEVWLCWS